MNYSLIRADRSVHLKVVCLALAGAIVVLLVGINARPVDSVTAQTQSKNVVKAGKPAVYAGQDSSAIR